MADVHRMVSTRKILVKDLNDNLTCSLCGGYFIDATTLVECVHSFCRACIVRHFESSRLCPNCGSVVHKSKPLTCLRNDSVLQSLVYKLVPALYSKELQRRADFYHSTSFRPNSACSDDSVLGDREDSEEWALSNIGDPNLFFSPDDSISLSLEYYQQLLENVDSDTTVSDSVKTDSDKSVKIDTEVKSAVVNDKDVKDTVTKECLPVAGTVTGETGKSENVGTYKRYLQCPAAVTMGHIMKFLRMKYALTEEHRVDIIYNEEVLPQYYSLMDVAYTFNWKKENPMRLFYRIFVPVIRPDIPPAPVKQEVAIVAPEKQIEEPKVENKVNEKEIKKEKREEQVKEAKEEKKPEKTVKFLDEKPKPAKQEKKPEIKQYENCVYDYNEQDKDELKEFAEKRDREWAMQKQEDEYHITKKRKKNKHSKNEFMHKKRKLHAEITSNEVLSKPEDSLKLKVKLSVANGHKHKHRIIEQPKTQELSPKERLLQMRQVRHKKIETPEEKAKNKEVQQYKIVPVNHEKKEDKESTEILPKLRSDFSFKPVNQKETKELEIKKIENKDKKEVNNKKEEIKMAEKKDKPHPPKPKEDKKELKQDTKEIKIEHKEPIKMEVKEETMPSPPHEFVTKNFTVSKIETGVKRKAEDKQVTIDKRPSLEITLINPPQNRPQNVPSPSQKLPQKEIKINKAIRPPPATIPLVRIQKSLNLKSGISIIPKMPEKCDNIGALDLTKPNKSEKPEFRKSESPKINNLRPNTSSPKIGNQILSPKTPLKNLKDSKSDTSQIEKISPNISNLQMLSESAVQIRELMAKNASSTPPIPNLIKKSPQLKIPVPQNSQMKNPNFVTKQQFMAKNLNMMPKSQALQQKLPNFVQKNPNFVSKTLQKLPKLHEINKSQFRGITTQIRNARPAQNQSIRNIPNPSLLVRQQNQNRINLMHDKDKPTVKTEVDKDVEKNIPSLKSIETSSSK